MKPNASFHAECSDIPAIYWVKCQISSLSDFADQASPWSGKITIESQYHQGGAIKRAEGVLLLLKLNGDVLGFSRETEPTPHI